MNIYSKHVDREKIYISKYFNLYRLLGGSLKYPLLLREEYLQTMTKLVTLCGSKKILPLSALMDKQYFFFMHCFYFLPT